jgi:flagellar biogenesis protein FliO
MLNLYTSLSLALVEDAPSRFGGSAGPDLTRYFVVCATLVVVTGLVAWGFRRLLAGNMKLRAAKRSIQTLDVLPLGGKRKLAVVRCYDRTFVIGLGEREITPIAELDSVEAGEVTTPPATKANDAAFAAALEAVRESMPKKQVAATRQPLPAPTQDVAELSTTAKRMVKRKVKKSPAKKATPQAQAAKKVASKAEALSVAAAAQEIARDKQRARKAKQQQPTAQARRSAPTQVTAPAKQQVAPATPQAATPNRAPETKPAAKRPVTMPRLEGVLG